MKLSGVIIALFFGLMLGVIWLNWPHCPKIQDRSNDNCFWWGRISRLPECVSRCASLMDESDSDVHCPNGKIKNCNPIFC